MQEFRLYRWIRICSFLGGMLISSLSAQDMTDYQRLRASGKVPAYFQIAFLEKFNPFVVEGDSSISRESQEEFWEESNQYINQLLLSGKVLYNDPVTTYINKVADHLLRKNPDLRRKLRFFAVRSPSVNAFSSNQGVVLVNLGLIARLDNEAQLAYILSHEISHIIDKHQLDYFLASQTLESQLQKTKDQNTIKQLLLKHKLYSQNTERQADHKGLKLFLNSSYNPELISRCFDILISNHIAYEDKTFDPHFIESNQFTFPPPYFASSPDSFSAQLYAYDPEINSSHPAAMDRKEGLEKLLQNTGRSRSIKKDFLVGENDFEKIRKMCRFETCFSLLAEGEYEKALYWSFLLSQEYPNNIFLQKSVLNALYGLTKYKLSGRFYDIHTNYEEIPGKAQNLFFGFEQLTPKATLALSLSYAWDIYQKHPEDPELTLIFQDLQSELLNHFPDPINHFLPLPNSHRDSTLYRKILYQLFQDKAFRDLFEPHPMNLGIVKDSSSSEPLKQEKGMGNLLGLKKLAVVNPSYFKIDDRFSRTEQFNIASRQEYHLQSILKDHALALEIDLQIVSNKGPEATPKFDFEDLLILSEWFAEKNQHAGLNMVSLYHNEVQHLVEKYNTQHFMWLEAGNLARSPSGKGLVISAGILLPVLLPYTILYTRTPKHLTFIYAKVFDLSTGEELAYYPQKLLMRDRIDVLRSAIYNLMIQVSSEP